MALQATPTISIDVACDDVLSFRADVLALKHAGRLHGADLAVVETLESAGIDLGGSLPADGGYHVVPSRRAMPAGTVLFIGTPNLYQFDYAAIREFSRRVLALLALHAPRTRHVALTLHGPGYGLDESEAFRSEVAGLLDAVAAGEYPRSLERITFVEHSSGRAARLTELLSDLSPASRWFDELPEVRRGEETRQSLDDVGEKSRDKPHIFVAMPFASEFDDLFHYGIQGAVNAAGFLCERADLAAFTGDVIAWVKERIASATFLVADLSSANPNVYLEVGYAWGKGIPTVLLARDTTDLKFDVRSQRCLLYKSIRNLEELLAQELKALRSRHEERR